MPSADSRSLELARGCLSSSQVELSVESSDPLRRPELSPGHQRQDQLPAVANALLDRDPDSTRLKDRKPDRSVPEEAAGITASGKQDQLVGQTEAGDAAETILAPKPSDCAVRLLSDTPTAVTRSTRTWT